MNCFELHCKKILDSVIDTSKCKITAVKQLNNETNYNVTIKDLLLNCSVTHIVNNAKLSNILISKKQHAYTELVIEDLF